MLANSNIGLLAHRMFSRMHSESIPVITIPNYMKNQMKKLQAKHEQRRLERIQHLSRLGNRRIPIITSPEKPELNHYLGRVYDSKKDLPLISLGWKRGKYRGHSFTIHKHAEHPCLLDPNVSSFSSLGLGKDVVNVLEKNGFKTPTVIQEDAIPPILNGENIVCCAETGSGKTLAYLAPLLQLVQKTKQLKSRPPMSPLAIVLIPSKELCFQISEVFLRLGAEFNLNICSMVPGLNLQENLNKCKEQDCVDIVVATLGSFHLLVKRGVFSVSYVDHVVVDEADTLLDNSFIDDLTEIMKNIVVQENNNVFSRVDEDEDDDDGDDDDHDFLRAVPNSERFGAQLLLVGATLPRRLEETFGRLVDMGSLTWVRTRFVHRLPPHLTHKFMRMGKEEKAWNLVTMVKTELALKHPLIIFSNNIERASWAHHYLISHEFPNVLYHKGLRDQERKLNFDAFQEGKVDIISCTDLASRGLDTGRAKHVLNLDFPNHMSDYIHRSGRTGRMASLVTDGQVTSFVCAKYEVPLVQQIEAAARQLKALPNVDANIKLQYEQYAMMHGNRKMANQQ